MGFIFLSCLLALKFPDLSPSICCCIISPSLAHYTSLKPFWKYLALNQIGFLHTTAKVAEGCSLIPVSTCSPAVLTLDPVQLYYEEASAFILSSDFGSSQQTLHSLQIIRHKTEAILKCSKSSLSGLQICLHPCSVFLSCSREGVFSPW